LGSLGSLDSLDSLDSLCSLDSSSSLPLFIVSYIIFFEFRIPQELRIHGIWTVLDPQEPSGSTRIHQDLQDSRIQDPLFPSCLRHLKDDKASMTSKVG
jgi:hypothetical protein